MVNCNVCARCNLTIIVFSTPFVDTEYFSDKVQYLIMWRVSFLLNAFILFYFIFWWKVIDGDFSVCTCVLHRNSPF